MSYELRAVGLIAVSLLSVGSSSRVAAQDKGAIIAESLPILELFRRTAEGRQREDWKLVVDSLQRIIDPEEAGQSALVRLGPADGERGALYESARQRAYRELAALPQAGRDVYHLLYEGEARRWYEQALADYDFEAMRHVVDRYLLTESGADATNTLASWLLDGGKPGPAISILTDLESLDLGAERESVASPERRQGEHRARATRAALLAVAHALLHRPDKASGYLDILRRLESVSVGPSDRAERIESYLQRELVDQRTGLSDSWPMAYGLPARTGRMPSTLPVLMDGLPWRYALPRQSPAPWSAVMERGGKENRVLPAQMVTDGDQLFVKADDQVAAIDLLTFEESWISRSPAPAGLHRDRVAGRSQVFDPWSRLPNSGESANEDERVGRILLDEGGAQLAVAAGLVFDLQSQDVGPVAFGQGMIIIQQGGNVRIPRSAEGNVLIARDPAQQGKVVWLIGAGHPSSHPLNQAVFAALPVAIGERLLVVYQASKDLFAGVLDRRDGSLIKSVYLCTLAEAPMSFPVVLPPAVDEQFAYVPTNCGMLLAIGIADAQTPELRWAAVYPRKRSAAMDGRAPPGFVIQVEEAQYEQRWLAGPPVAVGPLVLLAPVDSDFLYAFDRSTGQVWWETPREDHTYIVAADERSVWLGGRHLGRVELATGRKMWRVETAESTGRAVLCGERLLAPTRQGLTAIAPEDGQILEEQPLPPDHAPLGNLLCWGGALYSVDSEQVRKFPDLEQSYEPARRMHAQNPRDPLAAIRIAWMELLRQHPEAALAALEQVEIEDTSGGRRQAEHVIHLRVKALLAGTQLLNLSSEEQERRLREAEAIADTPEDQFRVCLALAERLIRNGKDVEAYQELWRAAHSREMGFATDVAAGWKRSGRAILCEKLAALHAKLDMAQLKSLSSMLAPMVRLDDEIVGRPPQETEALWDALAEGGDLQNWNQSAAIKLGRLAMQRRQYEKAEYYYRRGARTDGDAARSASALIELIEMYLREDFEAAHWAVAEVERLERDFPNAVIDRRTAADIAKELASRVQLRLGQIHKRFASLTRVAKDDRTCTPLAGGQLLHYQSTHDRTAEDLVVTAAMPDHLAAHRLSDGALVWEMPLRLPDESSHEEESGAIGVAGRPGSSTHTFSARSDGQTLLVNTGTGLHAVGLITGRRLWSIPLDVPAPRVLAEGEFANQRFFDISGGRVAVRRNAHQIDLVRSVEGRDLIWSVQVPEHVIDSVRIVEDRVVAVDQEGTGVVVLDLNSGRRLFELAFDVVHEGSMPQVQILDKVICGRETNAVSGYALADGKRIWSTVLQLTPVALFSASPECVVVGGMEGAVQALRAGDGEIVYSGQLPFGPRGVYSGHQQGQTLFLIGQGEKHEGQDVHLAALDLGTRRVLWNNTELGWPLCDERVLSLLPDRIPLLYQKMAGFPDLLPEFVTDLDVGLVLLDKRTGKPAMATLRVGMGENPVVFNGEMFFQADRIVLGSNGGVMSCPVPRMGG